MSVHYFDVAVAGGGPAGAMAALTLAQEGFSVALIESTRYEEPRAGETLPPAINPHLLPFQLNAQTMQAFGIASYGNQSVWGGNNLQAYSFIFQADGNGWHICRPKFDEWLFTIAARAGVHTLKGRQVTACTFTAQKHWQLQFANGEGKETITATALIEATGRRASLAKWLGAKKDVCDTLVGVAMQYKDVPEQKGYTLIEAVEDGWWYSAPLPSNGAMVMLMTDADLCRLHHYNIPQAWQQCLSATRYTAERVAGCVIENERPLVFSAASHRLRRRDWQAPWLACGDAAMSFDPISSSGVVNALQSGKMAARALSEWLHGTTEAAKGYEHWLDREYGNYLAKRRYFYLLESRWPECSFWKRRHQ